jgi:hypothetical protein
MVGPCESEEAMQVPRMTTQPWAQVLTLGDQRFGILMGGPFDGRCYPLMDGTPAVLDVPGPEGPDQPRTVRYVLHEGFYRFAEEARTAA